MSEVVALSVTQEDIDKFREWYQERDGGCGISCNCPVSNAIRRVFPFAKRVQSADDEAYVDDTIYILDSKARKWAKEWRFEVLEIIKPFQFTMTKLIEE